MKTKLFLSISSLFIAGCLLGQTSGGPDTYGYTWKNQAEPVSPPVYKWKEIKSIGTQIAGLGDDNAVGPFSLNWNFHYYWTDYNKITVGSNGWIGFAGCPSNIASPFPVVPSAGCKNTIAAMLSDLTFTKTGGGAIPGVSAWYWSNNVDTMIVQYDSVPYWEQAAGFTGANTFQIILSGADSSITFQYKLQTGLTNGTDLHSGLSNLTGQIGLLVMNSAYPVANDAVKFYYPNPVTYQVFDATPSWNQNAENGGFFVSAGGNSLNMTTDISNAGNQTITNIGAHGQILNAQFTPVWDTTAKVSSLVQAADSTFAYPKKYAPTTPGTFTYKSTVTLTGDMNPGNDITDVEMVVVDTTQSVIHLSYSADTVPGGSLNWSGGNAGAAVYIIPPFYPAVIKSADFMITNLNSGGFVGQIFDDNGPNGSHGTIMFADSTPGASMISGAYNNLALSKPIVLLSGGVYVAWMMKGDSVGLGTDPNAPLSLRGYEIIGGAWGGYRNSSSEDLMIRLNVSKYDVGVLTTTSTPDACPSNNTGSATVAVSAGVSPPYTYMWIPSGQTTATATGLAAGTHTVVISDSLGYVKSTTVMIYNNIAVTAVSTASVTCFGGSNGASMATIGGTSPYIYMWSNGQTTQTATGLTIGVYTVTASNNDGCTNWAIDTIIGATALANTFTTTAATCVGGNGTATAIPAGGTSPYTYLWSNLQATATSTGLTAGTYSVVITDGNGCSLTGSATVPLIPFVSTTAGTATKCFGTSDGVATSVVSSGGTPPYTYLWTPTGQATQVATGLSAGSYVVVTTDAAGCSTTKTVTITSPATMSVTASANPASCTTCTNGSASAITSGGTPNYTYVWSNGVTAQSITGLTPGNYTVCVTDLYGCSSCDTVNVVTSGISEIYTGASVVISPNPFNSSALVKINFVNPGHVGLRFTIYDIYGREVQSIDLGTYKGSSIDFTLNRGNNITNGMYFYRVEDENTILSAGKLMIQ